MEWVYKFGSYHSGAGFYYVGSAMFEPPWLKETKDPLSTKVSRVFQNHDTQLNLKTRDRNRLSAALFHRTENDPGFLHGRGWSQGLHVSHQALSCFLHPFWKKVLGCFSYAISVAPQKKKTQETRASRGHLVIQRSQKTCYKWPFKWGNWGYSRLQ